MSLYQLKSQFQDQLRPISDALVEQKVTANQVTVSAVVLSLGTAYMIAKPATEQQALWLLLPSSLFVRMALNAIDGMMAREHGQASRLGAVLNEVGDIVADTALIASLAPHIANGNLQASTVNLPNRISIHQRHIIGLIALSISTELLGITSNTILDIRANQGPLGKSDRAFLLGLLGAFMVTKVPTVLSHIKVGPLLILTEALLLKTCLNRLRYMADLYLMRKPPALRSNHSETLELIPESSHKSVFLLGCQENVGQPNTLFFDAVSSNFSSLNAPLSNFAIKTSFLEPKIMPTTPLDSHEKVEQVSDTLNLSSSKLISGESCYNAYDGTAIYYRYWLTMPLEGIKKASQPLRQVILLHRGHEHSGRLAELGQQFAAAGYQVFAWDARGNGRSGGIKDHAESVTELERDLDGFVQLVIGKTGIAIEDTLIVASSIGAVLAAAWVHDYAPNIRGMILGTPALSIRLYMPFAIPSLKVARALGLMSRVSSYVKAQVLTHDKDAQQAYNADPLISNSISTDLLIDTHATGQRLLDDASAITVPTFVLCAGKDYVVDKQAERDFYEAINATDKRWQLYPDSYHAIFHETNKADVFADCINFAEQVFSKDVKAPDLSAAHLNSASKDKVDRLAIKPFNPSFAITRFAMQKFGHVSDAIATGLEHGFDSGHSLDHVYYNQPSGQNKFGQAVDKFYLSNIGWQGIRIRREHILELAREALADIEDKNQSITKPYQPKLLDIASGHGFYAFDLLTEFTKLHAELRDYEMHNIQALQAKAEQLEIANRLITCQKDAFDPASYSHLQKASDNDKSLDDKKFDIAIASGVFELFSDNTLPATALAGIYDSLKSDGYLLYTNQPWHPEQEFISKTLNNHRGSSWVMRCRSQAEMDQLVENAGFKKVAMRIDRFGIFTVSLAIKTAPNAEKG
ncbi:alpha-beta hydrolase superfamily lysophospholipase [Psychrobacter immobilis]|uniref:Alpha-beta hydrolase superfamily lysophospholipase n=1 Tax=Psychrobacter immobilis TaxID=498 RepID=A0A2V1ZTU6_PSYIM|nr:alpha/beta fold hydrolase [Psychrobacter immobilis]PWK06224.1 alpha-beta hydrolase superfamily lysophospholipase [Psychrobacter immobilis]